MPRIVPLQLLKCLRVLLDNNGGILSSQEVKRIAGLMAKYSKKLVSKCVYVQILKSTKTELLGDFMAVGGWSLVYTWLNDAIRAMNWPLVQEILELLLLSPVDVQRLRINSAPVLVKGLCKDGGNEGVRILAKRLVEQWLKIVTGNSSGIATGGSSGALPAQSVVPAAMESDTSEMANQIAGSGTSDSAQKQAQFMEHSSSDSTDSGGAPETVNYTITSALRKSNTDSLVLKLKPIEKSSAAMANSSVLNEDDSSLPQAEAGVKDGAEGNTTLDNSDKTNLNDSSTTESKTGEDADKKHKSSRDKSKKSDKDREKDRKSSSNRSSSSSHKSSSSSSSSSKSSSKSSSSSSHRSSSDKHRDKDKARSSSGKDKERKEGSGSSSSSSSSSSNKHKSSSKSSSSSSSSSSKDRSRDKDKEKSSSSSSSSSSPKTSTDKDNKLMPPPVASVTDKKAKDSDSDVQKPKSIPIMYRKASISIETRRDTEKGGTVKTYQSKFRSHGLNEEAPPPPSRKGLKKPTFSTPATSTLLGPALKRPSPPPRDSPTEKKPKIDINNVSGHVERPGAAKLIAPKKIQTLVETNLFSDALTASIEPKKVVKRKRPLTAVSPTEKEAPVAPLKFYQDTLDESKSEDKSDESAKEGDDRTTSPNKDNDVDDDDIPLKKVKEDIEQKVQNEKSAGEGENNKSPAEEIDDTPPEPKKPGPGCGPDGPPGVLMLHRRKGPKKKLTWQTDDKLTQVRLFEVDRSERINVSKQSFLEMKNMERYSERDALNIARRGFDDRMVPQTEWRPLLEVDNVPAHPNGNLSKQRAVQAEREATTLSAYYFSIEMIPDSAAEAEIEPHFAHDIPVIPMDDLTGNPDAVNDYSSLPWPEPKGYANSTAEMNFGDNMNNMMHPGMAPNMMNNNPFQPFGNNFMPNAPNMPPNAQMPMNMPPVASGPPNIWPNPMGPAPIMNNMNGPGMDMNPMGGMPPNFMGPQFGSPGPFGQAPPGFNNNMNNMNYPPMMGGPPMMNGPGPMPNGMGPMNGGPRNNNNRKGGGNWRSGGNNFQDNSGGNWRSAGSGPNRIGGGGVGGNNNGICKQFMRGHCNLGKSCKYVHPQKKRM